MQLYFAREIVRDRLTVRVYIYIEQDNNSSRLTSQAPQYSINGDPKKNSSRDTSPKIQPQIIVTAAGEQRTRVKHVA